MQFQVATVFLDCSSRKLEEMTACVKSCVGRLSEDQVWQRNGEHENAVANLILHLCGNARQWIIHGVGGAPDVRERDLEFSARNTLPRDALLTLFVETMNEARNVIATITPERMLETVHPQGRTVRVMEAIYQVVGHVQQHTGQIVSLTKQITRTDLDLTIPRPR